MRIVEPSATLEWITPNAPEIIEQAGRTCYQSSWKIEPGSAPNFIRMIMKSGHLSVIEHASASIRFVVDRGVSHELVRHRLASFSQESSRFCNYSKDRFGGEIAVIKPPFKDGEFGTEADEAEASWEQAMEHAERSYFSMLNTGQPAEIARSVLPTCLKTEIVVTCNFRNWLLIFAQRTDDNKRAHPQIRRVMNQARALLFKECPAVFGWAHASPVEQMLEFLEASE